MSTVSIIGFLQARQAAMLGDLREFVERETPSTERGLLKEFATFLSEYASSVAGGRAETLSAEEGATHVRAEFGANEKISPILLLGHFDTVWPVGTLNEMPFRVQEGRAYGPGCFDMKAGLVQGLWALQALMDVEGSLRPVVLLATCDEEIGSPTSRALIEDEARRAAAVFVLEPSLGGGLKTARKGVGRFRIEVTGRAAHSGLDPGAGVSAIDELSRLVLELHELSDADRSAGTSLNVGVFGGGTRYNVVAAKAWAEVDLRVVTNREAERLTELIHALKARHPDATVEVDGGLIWPPMERTRKTEVLLRHARGRARELGFELTDGLAGGASDGNFCAAVGAAVLDGLGPVGAGAHAAEEHVVVSEMPRRAALVAELIKTFDSAIARGLEQIS